jgi:hypothetical protein
MSDTTLLLVLLIFVCVLFIGYILYCDVYNKPDKIKIKINRWKIEEERLYNNLKKLGVQHQFNYFLGTVSNIKELKDLNNRIELAEKNNTEYSLYNY